MAHRAKAGHGDKRKFRNTAKKTKMINVAPKFSRGGIRL